LLSTLVVLRRYWVLYGRQREGFELLEQALAVTSPGDDPALRAKALVRAASLAESLEAEACARYAKAGGELAAQAGDGTTAALAAAVIASVNGLAGRYDEADGERALHLARQAGDPLVVCEALFALGLSIDLWGPHSARCRAAHEELLATADYHGDIGFSLFAHLNLFVFGYFGNDTMSRGSSPWRQSSDSTAFQQNSGSALSCIWKVTTRARSRSNGAHLSRRGARTFHRFWLIQPQTPPPA